MTSLSQANSPLKTPRAAQVRDFCPRSRRGLEAVLKYSEISLRIDRAKGTWLATAEILQRAARSAFFGDGSAMRRLPFRGLLTILTVLAGLVAVAPAGAQSGIPRSDSPEGARVYFISPQAGQTVSSPVTVRFGLRQMGVAPAGVARDATGHHHLVLDAELPPVALPIPTTDHYRHFGLGQTEVDLELTTGIHTLQLLVGDHNHIPHDPPVVSERITITVR